MLNANVECQCCMPMLKANVEGHCWLPRGSLWHPWNPYGGSEAAFGCPWGCIWPLRGSIWLPMGLHMAAQRLHLAAEGLHFAAQGPSMAPMRQICSICCIWLGQAGVQDGREHGQSVVNGCSWATNPSTRMRDQGSRMNHQGSRMKYAQGLEAADGKMVK